MNTTVAQAQSRVEATVVQLLGDLNAASYRDLIAAAQDVLRAGASKIFMDLDDMPYMSSSGVVAAQSIGAGGCCCLIVARLFPRAGALV